ncbi:hypothetical protein L249_5248 [Ophiocordyceps polyrhachis-furcata BCC 54312]|uniref:Malonyl-CoA:ACP transacylase (MAT) domain-containing protein n=1 Tax=Ophiocordyceps polyrhachis-furcata BCC 54312 TaxID=1330021 RepID=A0A367L8U7_9HYPO|nr:hypothetical protein L249_5248 [Ophiocordyceps polyrhachis-furcata BCC 54312]
MSISPEVRPLTHVSGFSIADREQTWPDKAVFGRGLRRASQVVSCLELEHVSSHLGHHRSQPSTSIPFSKAMKTSHVMPLPLPLPLRPPLPLPPLPPPPLPPLPPPPPPLSRRGTDARHKLDVERTAERILRSFSMAPMLRIRPRQAVCFVFTGSGAQWFSMGRELLAYDVFRTSLETSGRLLEGMGCGWSLIEEMFFSKKPRMDEPSVFQPACTALQLALADLLDSWSVRPSVVVGHSSGEIAAAYVKRAISRRSALKIAFARGLVSDRMTRGGGMHAVGLGEEQVEPLISLVQQDGSYVVVGCDNSPESVTISGDLDALAKTQLLLEKLKVFNRRVRVKNAYHAVHVDEVADAYLDAIGELSAGREEEEVDMFSSVTGGQVGSERLREASYWVSNLKQQVKFRDAMGCVLAAARGGKREGSLMVTEIGPHPALQSAIQQTFNYNENRERTHLIYTSMLSREQSGVRTALEAMDGYWSA